MAWNLRSPFPRSLPHPVVFRTASLEAGSAYPRHRHLWGELVYAFTGVMELKLADRHYLAPPQCAIWLPPGVEHAGLNRYEATFCSLYLARARCRPLPRAPCALEVRPLVRALLEELRAKGLDHPRTAAERRMVDVLVDQLAAAPVQGTYLPTSDEPSLRPILAALEARPDDGRGLADWARQVHATERTLLRRFQRELGMPFGEWRQRLRVVKALAMLEAGRPVEAIALDLGYGSASAFIAMFRRMTGTSPGELRRSGPAVRRGPAAS